MIRWLAISNFDNWDGVRKTNTWGVANRHRNTVAKVKPGDTVLIYVSSRIINKEMLPPSINGVYEVTSEVYEDETPIFTTPKNQGNEKFPLRIKLKPIKIFTPPVEFKPLIPDLAFITNKKMWNGHIRGKAMRQIPEEDYQLIISRGNGK
jgi:predicted RNA-binding protein